MNNDEDVKVSKEFISLCESQLNLILQSFLVQESAIYLTTSMNNETPKLIPILVYPNSLSSPFDSLAFLPSSSFEETLNESFQPEEITSYPPNSKAPYQLILPLIYQDLVLGLLAIKRNKFPWQKNEIVQIKEIAQTISFARIIEQKQQLTQIKLNRLEKLRILENNHIEDFLHQLRNPLTAIRTFGKLLLKRLLNDEPNYKISENIIRESDRLKDLITDFNEQWEGFNNNEILPLNTSFFLTEKIENLEKFEIQEIINPLILSIQAIADEKNIQILTEINHNLSLITTNKKALGEILNNLLENAVKYTPINGKILLETNQNELELIIKISDTGYGIPEEDQQHIFERHYRGIQSQSSISGSGLGLAIVKELCDQIGIKISLISPFYWIKNQQYQGTQFSLFIPLS
ncbi:MAG: HAMP domain-containing histidine kinase [Cyanobacteria bacterium]|nr:HAMP domain-containing histidine kinase [Cyanobacteria bacterium CG_2015-16_32_12]NCO76750.1 HAMP domain-containing histidine kinase [Cyanobacteria bacterium CG_2015-22_32_23]NCQ04396.1 HAMP domain-containing histidine kinase [Cyanobacteria bacterium CG_2015-09_32_10]NCQ40799.1 HAMP domain-containing histidine kinase [Cyanobacteria bacterium CG_2015-04_32_10]NCS84861.1 HAMP domain-containing histidine kinase [Cyanobacteria bacterium CG_2015-02_32_10]